MKEKNSKPGFQTLMLGSLIHTKGAFPMIDQGRKMEKEVKEKMGNFNSAIEYIKLKDQLIYAKKVVSEGIVKLAAGAITMELGLKFHNKGLLK